MLVTAGALIRSSFRMMNAPKHEFQHPLLTVTEVQQVLRMKHDSSALRWLKHHDVRVIAGLVSRRAFYAVWETPRFNAASYAESLD